MIVCTTEHEQQRKKTEIQFNYDAKKLLKKAK